MRAKVLAGEFPELRRDFLTSEEIEKMDHDDAMNAIMAADAKAKLEEGNGTDDDAYSPDEKILSSTPRPPFLTRRKQRLQDRRTHLMNPWTT